MPRQERWSAEKRARFTRDWNAGLAYDALREKYDVVSPSAIAHRLKAMGFQLRDRRPRKVGA